MSVSNMKRLTVFAFREDADKVLRKLMNLRCVEVGGMEEEAERFSLTRLGGDERLAESQSRITQITKALEPLTRYTTRKKGLARIVHHVDREAFVRDGRAETARKIVKETNEITEERKRLTEAEMQEKERITALTPWIGYDLPLDESKTKSTVTLLGSFPPERDMGEIFLALSEAGAFAEVVNENESGNYCSVTFHRLGESEIRHLLSEKDFLESDFSGIHETANTALEKARENLEKIDISITRCEEKLRKLAENLGDVEILYDVEETNRREAVLRQRLAQTNACTVLGGWYPAFCEDAVKETLERFDCAFELRDPEADEEPPVLLRNNKFAVNFEWVLGMYAYPKYGRFDPTFLMSIFYFLIFGLMFADVGYGLLLVIGCFGGIKLLNPKPAMKRMLCMFGYCGISAIVMGVLFGGWFGDLPVAVMQNLLHMENADSAGIGHFFGNGLWFSPLNDPMTFLILSLAMGGVHLITGMAVKLWILCKDGKMLEGLSTIVPYWVLFAGLLLFLVNGTAGAVVSAVGAGAILLFNGYGVKNPFKRLFKGLGGLYGLVSYASDLLSYSRILALGLVAGVISKVINLITMMGSTGVIGFLVMVVVLVAGHVLNLAINVLGSFVHTSRLQYLEFFGKFYEDGGKPFDPAVPAEEYSEQIENP